jgi:hypothetical protein
MSALGQKQTYAAQQVMTALLPIATAKADICASSCPLYLRKRTCAVQLRMSALGQYCRVFYPPGKSKVHGHVLEADVSTCGLLCPLNRW